jgi:two-component system, cell cycle sensor histidine kinase and response regulator CckA
MNPVSSKTILAVDTDATVLMFVSTLLRQKGHHVLEAKSGAKALEILNMFPTKINFLVADVNMEPVTGREVAENVRKKHPAVKTLYLTNNAAAKEMVREDVREKRAGILPKPFTPANFLKAVDATFK